MNEDSCLVASNDTDLFQQIIGLESNSGDATREPLCKPAAHGYTGGKQKIQIGEGQVISKTT